MPMYRLHILIKSVQPSRNKVLLKISITDSQNNFILTLRGPNIRPAEPNEFPSIVSIIKSNFDPRQIELSHRCTGSLISKQDVLTAEHCLRSMIPEAFKILVGSHDLYNAIMYSSIYFWSYADWVERNRGTLIEGYHDIALIKLSGNVPDNAEPLPVWNLRNFLMYGMDVLVSGWGILSNGTIPRFLQTTSLKVISNANCENRVFLMKHERHIIYEHQMCTIGNPIALLTDGDSGGPLIFFGVITAVNSGVCTPVQVQNETHHVNIHMGINQYYKFIQDTLKNHKMVF